MADFALEAILKRDTAVVAAALLALMVLAWLALLAGAGTGMDPFAMSGWLLPSGGPAAESWTWTPAYWLIAFCMWAIMMLAMMLASASPIAARPRNFSPHIGALGSSAPGAWALPTESIASAAALR